MILSNVNVIHGFNRYLSKPNKDVRNRVINKEGFDKSRPRLADLTYMIIIKQNK